jgi:chromosome segregation ATPase
MPFPSLDIPLDIPDEETLRRELDEMRESLERKEESLKRKQDSLERREETVERKERKIEKDREKLEENEDMWMNVLRDLGVDPDALLEVPEGEFTLPDEPLDPREVLSRIPPPILEKMRKRESLTDQVAKLSLEEADKSKFFVF